MRQYVNFQDDRAKIPLARGGQIDSFDYLVVDNEHEALVLEKNLINQYSPFFNADFKDNKSYPFIALTKGDVFPAIKYTREKHKSDTKYFGPYTDSPRRPGDDRHRPARGAPVRRHRAPTGGGLTRALEQGPARLPEARCAGPASTAHVGLGPGACCGGHHAGGVRPERAAHRALPRPATTASSSTS